MKLQAAARLGLRSPEGSCVSPEPFLVEYLQRSRLGRGLISEKTPMSGDGSFPSGDTAQLPKLATGRAF
jgi:hypothetical protein